MGGVWCRRSVYNHYSPLPASVPASFTLQMLRVWIDRWVITLPSIQTRNTRKVKLFQ